MKSNISQQLGKKIQHLRKIKGLSQEIFAEKIGIATQTLSSIERGNAFMTAQTLEKIINLLDIKPEELFTFSDQPNNQDIYNQIIKKLDFLKNNKEKLKIIYNVINAIID